MDLVTTKIIVAILFGVVRFLCGISPLVLYKCLGLCGDPSNISKDKKRTRREQLVGCFLSLFQSFGGGVLFATAFLHMMPEVYFAVEELKSEGQLRRDYPFSQLIVSCGFFLVYFLEELSNYLVSITPQETFKKSTIKPIKEETKEDDNSIKSNGNLIQVKNGVDSEITLRISDLERNQEEFHKKVIEADEENNTKNGFSGLSAEEKVETDEIVKLLDKEEKTKQQILRCILIVIALSLHAIFEGLAIGLQHSNGNIWYLFISVSVHTATILFCMGLELMKAGTKIKNIVWHIFTLSVMSPIGILIGLAISLSNNIHPPAKSLVVVVLEGFSAGTILYITFFEVLNREKELRIYRLKRAICIVLGFVLMAILESIKVQDRH